MDEDSLYKAKKTGTNDIRSKIPRSHSAARRGASLPVLLKQKFSEDAESFLELYESAELQSHLPLIKTKTAQNQMTKDKKPPKLM